MNNLLICFQETSASCYKTIHDSWDEIDKIASQPNGLLILSEKFNTCQYVQTLSFVLFFFFFFRQIRVKHI
jgi:lysosomal Pro-X carboxypeptidase